MIIVVGSPVAGLVPLAGPLVASPTPLGTVEASASSILIAVVVLVVHLFPGVVDGSGALGRLGEGKSGFQNIVGLDDNVNLSEMRLTRLLDWCQFLQAFSF